MTARFSGLMFDVFPCEAFPVADPLKIRVICVIRLIRDSDAPLHNRDPFEVPVYDEYTRGRSHFQGKR